MNDSVEETSQLNLKPVFISILVVLPLLMFSSCANKNIRQKPELGLQVWNDTVEGRINEKYEIIWRTVKQTLEKQGDIVYNDSGVGRIEADIQGSRVVFWLKQIEQRYGLLRIRAYQKENFDPNITLAYQIFEEVNLVLNQ